MSSERGLDRDDVRRHGNTGRAPLAPEHDRMMRPVDLVAVVICEQCKAILETAEVAGHFTKTGHGTYNAKRIPRQKYLTRFGS